jgi:subtilase family serine protease
MHLVRARWVIVAALMALLLGSLPLTAARAATPCADVTIPTGGITVNPTIPIVGQPATINITVQNLGTCAAQAFVVQWKESTNSPTGPSTDVSGLGIGQTTVVHLVYSFPQTGNYLSIAQVNSDNTLPETNYANDLQILAITVQAATVDLTISSFTVTPVNPVAGTTSAPPLSTEVVGRVARASITIQNLGNNAAGAFRVDWQPGPAMAITLSTQVNSLGAGKSTTVTFDYTYGMAGTYSSTATVNSTHTVVETNDSNDSQSLQVLVEPALPDLVLGTVTFSPSPPIAGSPTIVTITIKNTGHAAAGPFQVDFASGLLMPKISRQVNGLAEGATSMVAFAYTYPFSFVYNSTATVDSTNRVMEIHEDNNSRMIQVPVGKATVDLTITNLTITCRSQGSDVAPPGTPPPGSGCPVQGEPATVSITIKNLGNTAAGSFVVSWDPNTFYIIVPSNATLTQQVNGLGAGQSMVVTFTYTYPNFGFYRTLAQVDAFNTVVETNEANNFMILNVTASPEPINLVVTGFTLSPTSPKQFGQTTATITVLNNSNFPTAAFAVQWKLHNTDGFGPLASVTGLLPHQSQTVTLTGTYFVKGPVLTQAIADPFNSIIETTKADNVFSRSITVVAP